MNGKEDGGGEGGCVASGQAAGQNKNQIRDRDVAENRRQVPALGIDAEESVVQTKPEQKQRAVIVSADVRIEFAPDVGRKIMGKIAPRMNCRILDDLGFVVVDELKSEGGNVNEKGERASQRLGNAALCEPIRAASISG